VGEGCDTWLEEKCIQNFGGETIRTDTTLKIKTWMRG
jgi:hypothetical protein